MKIDFVADTNFLVYILEGNHFVEPFLEYNFGVSFVSEVELLGYPNISEKEVEKISSLLADCFLMEWPPNIKSQTIALRRHYRIKLPDAIVAATAIVHEIPLVTADKGFKSIKELDLILLDI